MAFPGTDPIRLLVRSFSSSCVPHVFEDFARLAERFPDRVAVECCPRAHVDTCTCAELAGFASQLAATSPAPGRRLLSGMAPDILDIEASLPPESRQILPPCPAMASAEPRLSDGPEPGPEHLTGSTQRTLARFGCERLLYRLSKSEFADHFILKGAALLLVWLGETTRPTKDVDLLGFGDASADALKRIFAEPCQFQAPEDGLTLVAESVRVEPIRQGQEHGGIRVTLMAMLGNIRIPLQVDIGAGDAVVPSPDTIDYPGLLDLPCARVRVYRPETSIAEKTEGMVRLGLANSRMKDFFDVRSLAMSRPFDGETLRLAPRATFERRQTPLPSDPPLALIDEFATDVQKGREWDAFVGRIRGAAHPDFTEVIGSLRVFLWPALEAAATNEPWQRKWAPGGSWKT